MLCDDNIFGFEFSKTWDYENGFYLTSHVSRLAKSIAHYELYKRIVGLPGDIVEAGTFKGASFIRFATFREMLESQHSRKLISFDIFGRFPEETTKVMDTDFIEAFSMDAGEGISKEELKIVLEHKGIVNYELVQGNILHTIPEYVANNPQLRISLLHIDVDVYDATFCCLSNLYERVVVGGIIVFDDYGVVHGETKAIDDFFKNNHINATLRKLPFYKRPSYMVKE